MKAIELTDSGMIILVSRGKAKINPNVKSLGFMDKAIKLLLTELVSHRRNTKFVLKGGDVTGLNYKISLFRDTFYFDKL